MPFVPAPGGSGSAAWESAGGQFKILAAAIAAGDQVYIESQETDGAAQLAHVLDTANAFSNATSKLLSVQNATTEKFYVDYAGNYGGGGYLQVAAAQVFVQKDANEWIQHLNLGDGGWSFKSRRVCFQMYNDTAGGLDDARVQIGSELATRGRLEVHCLNASKAGVVLMFDESNDEVWFWCRDQTAALSELRIQRTDPGTDDTVGMLLGPHSHGEIYCTGASATQTTDAVPGNFDVVTGFTTNSGNAAGGVTEDAANDKITVNEAGTYLVWFQGSVVADSGTTYKLRVYVNGVAQTLATSEWLADGGVESISGVGLVVAAAGVDIDLRVADDAGSANFTPHEMQLCVLRVN